MKIRNKIVIATTVLIIPVLVFFFSCNTKTGPENVENSPTSGLLKIFAEEGFALQLNSQVYTFGKIYPNSKIDIKYTNEQEAITGLFNDSCKVIAISRDLSTEERAKFKAANMDPVATCIVKDAIALVVSSSTADSAITIAQLQALLSGDTSAIKGINAIVFDSENSSSANYLKDSVLKTKAFGKNCFAVKNAAELIEKVSANKNIIGVIDYAWLSDKDEPLTQDYLKKVKTLAVSSKDNKTAYFPDQSNIETGDYPFTKKIYMMRRSADYSLGAGIITFVAGPKGQIMMLKAGLAPARQPERVIEVNMSPLKNE